MIETEEKEFEQSLTPVIIDLSKDVGQLTAEVKHINADMTNVKLSVTNLQNVITEKVLPEVVKIGANLDSYEFKVKTLLEERVNANSGKIYELDKKKLNLARFALGIGLVGGIASTFTIIEIIHYFFSGGI